MATWAVEGPFGVILRHTTTRADGDFAVDAEPCGLAARRAALVDRPWVWLRQVHGADVVVVTADNAAEVIGSEADALVTAEPGLVLAVQTADCVPVVLHSPEGVIAAAHAGWRGLEAGVIERTLTAMTELGATSIDYATGPFIHGSCYEFGAPELDRLVDRFGERVRSTTSAGTPALDLGEMLRASLSRRSRPAAAGDHAECTACHPERWFSHRALGDRERMATVIWREPTYAKAMVGG